MYLDDGVKCLVFGARAAQRSLYVFYRVEWHHVSQTAVDDILDARDIVVHGLGMVSRM